MDSDPIELLNEWMDVGLATATVNPDHRPTVLMVPLEHGPTKRESRLERHTALAARVLRWPHPNKDTIHWENSEGDRASTASDLMFVWDGMPGDHDRYHLKLLWYWATTDCNDGAYPVSPAALEIADGAFGENTVTWETFLTRLSAVVAQMGSTVARRRFIAQIVATDTPSSDLSRELVNVWHLDADETDVEQCSDSTRSGQRSVTYPLTMCGPVSEVNRACWLFEVIGERSFVSVITALTPVVFFSCQELKAKLASTWAMVKSNNLELNQAAATAVGNDKVTTGCCALEGEVHVLVFCQIEAWVAHSNRNLAKLTEVQSIVDDRQVAARRGLRTLLAFFL
jgi:hypothetical protein